ncbi:hypothetical protein [uncultured Draconibacterium sp.]|uniref:hypothetical protein n=1 Tax=uncultured Draconibacterium sp. TaxID=1573823 RepID=UPI0032609571
MKKKELNSNSVESRKAEIRYRNKNRTSAFGMQAYPAPVTSGDSGFVRIPARAANYCSKKQIAYGIHLTSMKKVNNKFFGVVESLKAVADKNLFGHEPNQKPIHKLLLSGETQTAVFLFLPLGGVGGGFCLTDRDLSITYKNTTGPCQIKTSKKHTFALAKNRRSQIEGSNHLLI